MADKQVRAAVIGCGGMGRNHVHALATMEGVELVGIADVFEPNLQRAGDEVELEPGARYLDYQKMLADQQPTFVVIATQTPQHAELTIACARQGIHVICEKPLALNLVEADAMVKACSDHGVKLAVNHLRRASPASTLAREMIAAGEIGDILAVDIHDKGGRPVGNNLMEMATHYFDEARYLLSGTTYSDGRRADEVDWVYAHLSTGINGNAHPSTPDEIVPSQVAKPTDRDCGLVLGERGTVVFGLAGEVQAVARFHNLPQPDNRYDGIDVIGTKGALAVRGGFLKYLFRRKGHTFAVDDRWQPVEVPGYDTFFAMDERMAGRWLCQELARDLLRAVETNTEPRSSGRDGLTVLEMLMAVYVSHRQGGPVRLPLADRRHPLEIWKADASS